MIYTYIYISYIVRFVPFVLKEPGGTPAEPNNTKIWKIHKSIKKMQKIGV